MKLSCLVHRVTLAPDFTFLVAVSWCIFPLTIFIRVNLHRRGSSDWHDASPSRRFGLFCRSCKFAIAVCSACGEKFDESTKVRMCSPSCFAHAFLCSSCLGRILILSSCSLMPVQLCTAGYLRFHAMAQCVVYALKGLACRASPSRAH